MINGYVDNYVNNNNGEDSYSKKPEKKQAATSWNVPLDIRPAKIRAVWSDSSLGVFGIAKDAKFLHADNDDADQTVQLLRLTWVCSAHMWEGTFSHVAA